MKIKLLLFFSLAYMSSSAQIEPIDSIYKKPLFDFDTYNPIFSFPDSQIRNETRFLRFYALSGYREGVPKTSGPYGINFNADVRPKSAATRLFMYNLTLVELLTHGIIRKDRVILEVKDPKKFTYRPEYGSEDIWRRSNTYCFELLLPEGTLGIAMLDKALSNALHLKFGKQRRKVDCLVLKRTSTLEKFKVDENDDILMKSRAKFCGVSFDAIGESLDSNHMPFIDETGYVGLICMDLRVNDWNNIGLVNKNLKRYDLKLDVESRELELFVISEIN